MRLLLSLYSILIKFWCELSEDDKVLLIFCHCLQTEESEDDRVDSDFDIDEEEASGMREDGEEEEPERKKKKTFIPKPKVLRMTLNYAAGVKPSNYVTLFHAKLIYLTFHVRYAAARKSQSDAFNWQRSPCS